jgi:hypothetical protein
MANVVGGDQSVGSIGCQTTNTRTGSSGCRPRIDSTAEDPRRQVAHVGESRTMIRTSPVARLKSARSMSNDPVSRWASGGWPAGALCVPNCRCASATSTMATSPTAIHPRRFTGMGLGQPIGDQAGQDLGKQRHEHNDCARDSQNHHGTVAPRGARALSTCHLNDSDDQ